MAPRQRLNRERVLLAAVEMADEEGLDAVSMRRLADHLGVVPMALYKHVANKDELLDGMLDVVIGSIEAPSDDLPWRAALRARVMSARAAVVRHRWARRALESRTKPTPVALDHLDALTGTFLAGGCSPDLTHHAMHALGSRAWGFSPELFDEERTVGPRQVDPVAQVAALELAADRYPNIATVSLGAIRAAGADAVHGCDEQFEFEFALDLLLDGIERLRDERWMSARAARGEPAG